MKFFLAIILLFGMWIRFANITWSLPNAQHPLATYHPDERINLNAALNADLLRGNFDIQFYNYGAFYFYLVDFAHIFGRGWGLIPSTPPIAEGQPALSQTEQMVRLAPENAGLFLAGRIVTALLGTATIAVLFFLGYRKFGLIAGLFAAMFYAVAPLAVIHAHFLTVDVPATFFVTLALLWAMRLLDSASAKDYALAGVWVGLSAATKYNTGLVLIAPVVAAFLNRKSESGAKHFLPNLGILIGATVVTFLMACPGVWLNWDAFWNGIPNYPGSGVRYELFEHSRQGHGEAFINTGMGWWYHLVVSLRYGFGLPFLLLALAGLVLSCVRRTRQDIVLLSFFFLYYVLVSLSAVRFARYMLPLFPVLCLFAVRLLEVDEKQLLSKLTRRQRLMWGLNFTALSITGCMITVPLLGDMGVGDTRDRVAEKMEEQAPQGTSVAFAKIPWFFSPPLSPYFGAPSPAMRAQAAANTTRYTLLIPQTEWDMSVLDAKPDYVIVSDLETVNAVDRLKNPQAVQWMDRVKAEYSTHWHPSAASFMPLVGTRDPLFPEDLRYITPSLWVFEKRK